MDIGATEYKNTNIASNQFKNFINEAGEKSLNPIVNNDMKFNTREEDEKVPAVSKAKYSMDTNDERQPFK